MNNKQKRPTKSVRPGEEQRRVPAWPFFLGAAALVAVVTISCWFRAGKLPPPTRLR